MDEYTKINSSFHVTHMCYFKNSVISAFFWNIVSHKHLKKKTFLFFILFFSGKPYVMPSYKGTGDIFVMVFA